MKRPPAIPPEVRYAKHRLLPEIGDRGLAALVGAPFRAGDDAASRFAATLLEHSGLVESVEGTPLTLEASTRDVDPKLRVARDATRGAIAAVQRIREQVGLPQAANLLRDERDRGR